MLTEIFKKDKGGIPIKIRPKFDHKNAARLKSKPVKEVANFRIFKKEKSL